MPFKQGNLATKLSFSLVLSVFLLQVAQAQTLLIPEELHEFAKDNGCSPIEDFYERPGMLGPPYVYGYLPGPQETSAVFWCQKQEDSKRKFFLLFMFENTDHELTNCPHKVEWGNYPRGLSIYNDRETDLGGFVYLNDPMRKGPKEKMMNNAVLSEYDGVGVVFSCYKGEWLIRQRH